MLALRCPSTVSNTRVVPSRISARPSVAILQRRHMHSSRPVYKDQTNNNQKEEKEPEREEEELDNPRSRPEEEGEAAPEHPRDVENRELKAKLDDMKSALQYTKADLENQRRIAKQDVANATAYGMTSFAKQMVEVADNLSRCISSVKPESLTKSKDMTTLFEGVDMTNRELLKALEKNGIKPINPIGEKFDPATMNALMHTQMEGKEPNTVGIVIKQGFTIKDRLLRPADVAVVKG
eukprot:TRINITY_DN1373_c0_g1_i1.p1 TRINITY_DN1373_c0_g1~~TRINITY_DN1373_c0_g1_i1.p1  ORF type:complete len:237 (-),score=48.49 TRINITY_DN1373_c0_g1_i1:133-843(-)